MKLVELNEKEFKTIADKSPQITFHQTSSWAELKKTNGWKHYYVALKDNKESLACALLLAKKIPIINKYIFYSPRGFLIDYNNKEILKEFTKKIKKFIKEQNGIFVKIDPYVPYIEHDNNGEIVKNGFNNKESYQNLIDLGYKHFGFNLMQDSLQPRWMHVIDTKDKTLDKVMEDMESKTRQILRKNEKSGITVREIAEDELPLFKDIMKHTSDRREFIDRPLSYYKNMWKCLHKENILKIMIAEINFDTYKDNTNKELKERIEKKENSSLKMNDKKYLQKNKQDEESIKRLEKQLDKIKVYKKTYGTKTTLGGILFLIYGNEVLSLYGGSEAKLMEFQSAYSVHFAGIKYAVEHNYEKYNFYGITGDFRKENPLYGLYLFKKSFGGTVVELIGEFDLIINKPLYYLYKIAFSTYHKLKNIDK